jgi:hypothetical protein
MGLTKGSMDERKVYRGIQQDTAENQFKSIDANENFASKEFALAA